MACKFKYLSIRKKLIIIITLVTSLTFIITLFFLYLYNKKKLEERIIREVTMQAESIGNVSHIAVFFENVYDVEEYLSYFKSNPNVEAACIFRHDTTLAKDTIIAWYYKGNVKKVVHVPEQPKNSYHLSENKLEVVKEIIILGEKVSTVFILSNTKEIKEQNRAYQRLIITVLVCSLVFVFFISLLAEKTISRPIFELSKIAETISNTNDYSVRISEREGQDETSILFRGFNHMISEIERKNKDIMTAFDEITNQKNQIESQKNRIEKQSEELERAFDVISEKNRDITDSINYAKRLQKSIFLPICLLKEYIEKSFIFFKPRDIVSGDFYWFTKKENHLIVAAVDCTGHGVPGAMLSIVGNYLFHKIVNENNISKPSEILNSLNMEFTKTFHASNQDNKVFNYDKNQEGMDLSVCNIELTDLTLEYAGALNSIYVIRKGMLIELKPDRLSIGHNYHKEERRFSNQYFQLVPDDLIYMFSDGFADQFGGKYRKKYIYQNFKNLLVSLSSEPIQNHAASLEKEILEWRGDNEQVDDILIIGLQV